jgi:hypothetical protein
VVGNIEVVFNGGGEAVKRWDTQVEVHDDRVVPTLIRGEHPNERSRWLLLGVARRRHLDQRRRAHHCGSAGSDQGGAGSEPVKGPPGPLSIPLPPARRHASLRP